ncbi:Dihydropterin pyrophosphokinase / Dihydropteroate synthase [Hibiscus syriacus]|uniref:Dihydropterin pyrophosphokinase / Dihydropteroate synthase n=1 Tax=Hibiscus syriacus TaxID=106335 RepID=A0A6A3BG65_HIBSY|nr:Dihydropterin pyrophosphokinase / Dihydropteroate synthase [Hibiscus syriacus]
MHGNVVFGLGFKQLVSSGKLYRQGKGSDFKLYIYKDDNLDMGDDSDIAIIYIGLVFCKGCCFLIIDACLGYRWALIVSSVLYSAGFFLLALGAWRLETTFFGISHCHSLVYFGFSVASLSMALIGCSLVLLTTIRTVIAALQKRHLNYRDNLDRVHPGDGEAQNQLTDHLKLLNNAAVKEPLADEMGKHKWRLCTVQEVEQTKLLIDIIPMSATFVVYGMVKSLGVTFFTEQANSMNSVPIVIFQLSQWISEYGVNKGYEMVLERRIQRTKKRYSDGVKIGLGMLASIICCAVASFVESKRLKALRGNGLLSDPKAVSPISGAWFALQFFFLSVMEGLAGGGIADSSVICRKGDMHLYLQEHSLDLGQYLNIGFIAILDYYSKLRYKESWLGDSLNQSRLDLIYLACHISPAQLFCLCLCLLIVFF